MRFFGSKESDNGRTSSGREERHSSAWTALLKELEKTEGLRVLDFGTTSSTNINFLTALGHSIYTANPIEDVRDPRWTVASDLFEEGVFDTEAFFNETLNFGDRKFDVVLLWDTVGYLPKQIVEPFIQRLYNTMNEDGFLLAFFPVKAEGVALRFHLKDGEKVDMQPVKGNPKLEVIYTPRQAEALFKDFARTKFFLAKDNLREALITR